MHTRGLTLLTQIRFTKLKLKTFFLLAKIKLKTIKLKLICFIFYCVFFFLEICTYKSEQF